MKGYAPSSLLQGATGALLLYGCSAIAAAGGCFAAAPPPVHLSATVENISYQGNSNYKAEITVYNRSDEAVTLKKHRCAFFAQTEVLGRWEELSASDVSPAGNASLPPRKGLRLVYILKIPLTIRELYRNGEGDINLMFRYQMRFVPGSENGPRSNAGESSYWVTPETNTWVLREGM